MTKLHNLITDNIDIWTCAIKKRSATGRGSNKKIELAGINKLRELILELAVRGKLVPQDSSDEPASFLLKNIAAEKAQLVKDKKIKTIKGLSEVAEDEKPFILPIGWEWARFPNVANYGPGRTPSTKNVQYWDDAINGIPWVSIADLNNFGFVTKTTKYISKEAKELVFKKAVVPRGTMLMSFKLTVGKVSILDIDAFHNEAIISIYPFSGISRDYLFRVLPSRANAGNKKNAIMGATLNSQSLMLLNIPVPPKDEQVRIVNKIDELMNLCDKLEQQTEQSISAHQTLVQVLLNALTASADAQEFNQSWARIVEHFDTSFTTEESIEQLKQTILQLAVMGKLVAQDDNDELASELLKRIAVEKEQLIVDKTIKKQKGLSKIVAEDKYFNSPESWEWSRIGDASLFTEYGISAKTYDDIDGIPVLKMGDIQQGKIILGDHKKASADYPDITKLMLKTGDVLYNRTNSAELVGKTGVFTGLSDTYSFASYLIRIRCGNGGLIPEYLNLVMNAPLFRKTQIEPYVKQQCGQANVNGTIMKNMIIPVAPVLEQRRIIDKANQLLDICEQLKTKISNNQTVKINLADALVKQGLSH
jgi:type I restriction enzyme S subunit